MTEYRAGQVNTLMLGPFVSNGDYRSTVNSLTLAPSVIFISKNDGIFAVKNDANTAYHDSAGWYPVPLDATDWNTAGRLIVRVTPNSALPIWKEVVARPGPVADWMLAGTSTLNVGAVAVATSIAPAAIAAIPTSVWNNPTRELTAISLPGLPGSVWNNPTRDLTALTVPGIAASVWNNPTRELTAISLPGLPGSVWNNPTRDLTALAVPGIAASVHYYPVTNSLRAFEITRIGHAVMAGTSTGGGTNLPRFFEPGVAVPVVQATVDSDGNRRLVSLTPGY